jgi:hypothetical protein
MRELDAEAAGIFRAILAELGNRNHRRIDDIQGRFMPAIVERLDENRYSLTHYGELNGDLMADPEMTFWFNPERKIYAASYRNDYMGVDRQALEFEGGTPVVYHHAVQRDMAEFADLWLRNIAAQQGIHKAQTFGTPHGLFRFRFDSEKEARAAGYVHWCTYDGVKIFSGGPTLPMSGHSLAVAVRPGRPAGASEME